MYNYYYLEPAEKPTTYLNKEGLIIDLVNGKQFLRKTDGLGTLPLRYLPKGDTLFAYAAHKLTNVDSFVQTDLVEIEKRPWYECPDLFNEGPVLVRMKIIAPSGNTVSVIREAVDYIDNQIQFFDGDPADPEEITILSPTSEMFDTHEHNVNKYLIWAADETV